MVTARDPEFWKSWKWFVQEVEFARNYPVPYRLSGGAAAPRNPILEQILPSLLYVKMVAIMDEAFVILLDAEGLTMPQTYKPTFGGRLRFLTGQGRITDPKALDNVRERRNRLAHEKRASIEWAAFGDDLRVVEAELEHLAFVERHLSYEFFAERSQLRASGEPGIACERDYRYGLRCDGKIAAEVSWIEKLHGSDDAAKASPA